MWGCELRPHPHICSSPLLERSFFNALSSRFCKISEPPVDISEYLLYGKLLFNSNHSVISLLVLSILSEA